MTRMNTNTSLPTLSKFAVAAVVLLTGACSGQPKTRCTSAGGRFSAKYSVTAQPAAGCAPPLAGDVLSIQSYNPVDSDGFPDFQHGTIAIQSASLGDRFVAGEDSMLSDP